MDSFYAPSKRSTSKEILRSSETVLLQHNLTTVLDALPYYVLILDENRQTIYANKAILSFLSIDLVGALGRRPGELINCIHSNEMKFGCGTSKNCRFCGAVNSILESQKTDDIVNKDCSIISSTKDHLINFEFAVSSNKFKIAEKDYTLFSLTDISDKKRRVILEKIFFHDLINSAGSLIGVIDLLRERNSDSNQQNLLNIASNVSKEIVEEVLAQRQILEAENNELIIDYRKCNTESILKSVVLRMSHHRISKDKMIIIDEKSETIDFMSDVRLLRRVVVNMVKNSLEAIDIGGTVSLKAELKNRKVIISVNNSGVIPEDVQLQIFHRSFSTKGTNRGLGTYSMKLLTEKYLKGKVYFTSDSFNGTTFYCEIPVD